MAGEAGKDGNGMFPLCFAWHMLGEGLALTWHSAWHFQFFRTLTLQGTMNYQTARPLSAILDVVHVRLSSLCGLYVTTVAFEIWMAFVCSLPRPSFSPRQVTICFPESDLSTPSSFLHVDSAYFEKMFHASSCITVEKWLFFTNFVDD